jgi:glycosyltransferase involved in cell wall biosynthesis
MKITVVSQSDTSGGAARAAFRLHKALLVNGVGSRMRVAEKKSDLATVDGSVGNMMAKKWFALRRNLAEKLMRMQSTPNFTIHSPSVVSSGIVDELNASVTEVVNLHWVCGEFLSVEDIGRISKPTVWTLHDMWAFCGAEHYAPDDGSARWRLGYRVENRLTEQKGLDIDRWVWNRKRKNWTHPVHIITPSRWLAECVRNSALMYDWPVTVIPNPLDTRQFQPWPKALARQILGLPLDVNVVLFGAIGGGSDLRKGWDLLQPALGIVADKMPDMHGVIFGQSEPINPPSLGMPLHWLGHLNDDVTLALLYSAADVMVVPSRQENLPQSGTEAQACGCPVVAFNCTGLPDVVAHEETGYLAKPYDFENLAKGIRWVLEDTQRHSRLRSAARARALQLWSPDVVVPQYMKVYEATIESHQK